MPETPDFTAHAGVALFPRTRSDLTSTTQCPACLQVLSSIPCANCGLDLGHPLAAELALVSADAAELLDTRVRLIGTIRFDTAAANAAASAPAAVVPAAAVQAPVQHAPVTPAPVVPAPDLPAPVPPAPMAPTAAATPAAASPVPTGPRRSSVQILLVIVGVSLLSIAATFFLVYAFINFGLIWRTAIIGTITVAAFAVATLLRRRGLVSTAEGIGALAVVLVYLDAYAMRANDLFGSSSADALGYWGAALVVSAAGFLAWHRFSGLRVASIAAFTAVTPGAGLLVAGLAEPLDDSSRVFLGFLAAALAGLVHPLASRLERAIPLTLASAALVVAFFLALVLRLDLDWASPLALVGVAIVAAAHTAVLARVAGPGRTLRGFGVGFAAMAALAVGAAAIAASYRALSFDNGTVAAVCSTTVIALVAWFLVLRTSAPLPLRVAGAVAIGMAVLALTVPTTIALLTTASLAVSSALLRPWRINAADPVGSDILFGVDPAASIVALAACVALTGGFVVVTGQLGRFRRRLYWALVALAIVAVPLLALQWAVLLGWYLLSAVGVAALVRSRHTDGAPRAPWATLALASGALGYAVSWASVDTWLAGTVAAVLLLLASRTALAAPLARAIGLGVAAILALVGAVALAQQSGLYAIRDGAVFVSRGTDASFDSLRFTSILSIALVGLSAASLPRLLSALDRRTLFFIGATATVLSVVPAAVVLAFTGRVSSTGADGPGVRSTLVEPLTSIVLAVVLLAALVAWLARRADASAVAERVAAGASLAAVTAWLLDSLAVGAAVDDGARSLAPVVAALLVGAGSIVAVARRAASPRTAVDTGVAVVASAGVLVAALGSAHLGWLALLLSAVTVLLMAISADGLIGSRSRRKHLGWVALALATIALWWRLADASVEAVEAYSLPLGGALLLIALLVWRTERRQPAAPAAEARGVAVAPLLLLIGSLVAIVPSAMATTSAFAVPVEGTGRAVVVGSAAAVLLLAGSLVRGSTALRPYLDAAAAAGVAGAVIVAIGRGIAHTSDGFGIDRHDDARLDAWLAVTAAVLAVAAVGQASRRAGDSAWTNRAAQGLVVVGIAVVVLFEGAGFDAVGLGPVRAVVVTALFSALYVVGVVVDRMPLTTFVARAALAAAVIAALVAVAAGAVDDVEWVGVPIAIALLVTGARTLARTPASRSWPTLGPGLAVLLLPSLAETLGDRPVWRLVAIGVVAIAALVVGLRRGLQAPFLVGAVVALVHGVATFAPQIRAVYELTEWWVWAGLGGILIIVLAALYERSLSTARNVVRGIAGLR